VGTFFIFLVFLNRFWMVLGQIGGWKLGKFSSCGHPILPGPSGPDGWQPQGEGLMGGCPCRIVWAVAD